MDPVKVEEQIKYAKIYEMVQTEGWKYVEKQLLWDEKFFDGILDEPRARNKQGEENREWVKDSHDIGHARGGLKEARKILSIVNKARRLHEKK